MKKFHDTLVSVICPIFNEEKSIQLFVDSIINQDYPKDKLEILFIDGNSTDNTIYILNNIINQYRYIKIISNNDRIVPTALNIGINHSKGDVIIRLDAHCIYPNNYISLLVKWQTALNADNVGGICTTIPANNQISSISISEAMMSRFAVGNSYFRIGSNKIKEVDTVPFGCYKKEIFNKIGLFDTELIRNQDDEFNQRLIINGGKIFLIPEIRIEYFARDSFRKLFTMFYQYGLFKPLVNKKIGKPSTYRQFAPVCFIIYLVLGFLISIYYKKLFPIYSLVLIIYLLSSFLFSIQPMLKHKKISLLFILPFTFFIIHISYGIGYFIGVLKIILNNKFSVKSNH